MLACGVGGGARREARAEEVEKIESGKNWGSISASPNYGSLPSNGTARFRALDSSLAVIDASEVKLGRSGDVPVTGWVLRVVAPTAAGLIIMKPPSSRFHNCTDYDPQVAPRVPSPRYFIRTQAGYPCFARCLGNRQMGGG